MPGRRIVRDDSDRQRFVATVAAMVEQYQVVCHTWVLMNNHYHLLLETPHANLSQALRHLNGVYTQAFNRRHRRVGHLFQGALQGDRRGEGRVFARTVSLCGAESRTGEDGDTVAGMEVE